MADRSHLLGRLRLDADLIEADAQRAGEALAHRRDVRRELGNFKIFQGGYSFRAHGTRRFGRNLRSSAL